MRELPEEYKEKFAVEAARFCKETGATPEQVQRFLTNIFDIYWEWTKKFLYAGVSKDGS